MLSHADDRAAPAEATPVKTSGVALVTGGAGFVGSNLCRFLLADGYRVMAVDNLITGRRKNLTALRSHAQFEFHQIDIVDPSFVSVFQRTPIDVIFHLACPTGVPNIQRYGEEMLLTNSHGTKHVIDLARQHCAAVILTSSCEIYGQPEVFPQHERYTGNVDPIGPRSAYEEGKRFAESMLITLGNKYGLDTKVVRIFNAYGPYMSPVDQRVIPRFLRSVVTGTELTIYGDGTQERTFLYVDDLVRGLLLVQQQGRPYEVYNLGSDRSITIKELADLVLTLTGRHNPIVHQPHFIQDHNRRLPSLGKVQALGWQPEVALEDGLARMIRAWRIASPARAVRTPIFVKPKPAAVKPVPLLD